MKITENFLLKNGYEKKVTRSHTDIFWKQFGTIQIYIHKNCWNFGYFRSGNDINIGDLKDVKSLRLAEKLLVIHIT